MVDMGRRTRIPVRVVRPAASEATALSTENGGPQPLHPGWDETPFEDLQPEVEDAEAGVAFTTVDEAAVPAPEGRTELEEWRDRTLRLQAEMDNYRKRQQRWAQDQVVVERHRLLGAFLRVVDDLERALAAPVADAEGLRQGVELTHRAAMQLLQREGVEPIEANNQAFDPNWHEAVATVARNGGRIGENVVVEVVAPGYRLGDHLLRPAKVVVAV